jgi:archaemetzincin
MFAGASALKALICLLITACLQALPVRAADSTRVIAVQPLGPVKKELVAAVRSEIERRYKAVVVVRDGVPMPSEAYYSPRNRYRAEKLLDYLDRIDRTSNRIIGLTTYDISTTKGIYPDWGILGLGSMSGHACVVSTFRMRMTEVSDAVFGNRLAKVVVHELGHTFGLAHCPASSCIMEDARGTVRTVDREKDFCDRCKKRLSDILRE